VYNLKYTPGSLGVQSWRETAPGGTRWSGVFPVADIQTDISRGCRGKCNILSLCGVKHGQCPSIPELGLFSLSLYNTFAPQTPLFFFALSVALLLYCEGIRAGSITRPSKETNLVSHVFATISWSCCFLFSSGGRGLDVELVTVAVKQDGELLPAPARGGGPDGTIQSNNISLAPFDWRHAVQAICGQAGP
jgi:hypothetical protein